MEQRYSWLYLHGNGDCGHRDAGICGAPCSLLVYSCPTEQGARVREQTRQAVSPSIILPRLVLTTLAASGLGVGAVHGDVDGCFLHVVASFHILHLDNGDENIS